MACGTTLLGFVAVVSCAPETACIFKEAPRAIDCGESVPIYDGTAAIQAISLQVAWPGLSRFWPKQCVVKFVLAFLAAELVYRYARCNEGRVY